MGFLKETESFINVNKISTVVDKKYTLTERFLEC